MTTLKNHSNFWLRDDAARAFDAYEDTYGILEVNSAGRTVAEQQELIDLWNSPNRPSWLFQPADPPETSPHVANGGVAVDIEDYRTFRKHCEEFGFVWYGPGDPVHFNFVGWSGSSGGSGLAEDGLLGRQSIRRWQEILGTEPDGEISDPYSQLVARVQEILNAAGARDQDGRELAVDGAGIYSNVGGSVGPSRTIWALQGYLGTPQDGILDGPPSGSTAVRALQSRLNAGSF